MELNFKNAIELIATFIAILFAIYLLTSKKDKSKSSSFMSIFLILFSLNLGQNYVEKLLNPISANLYVFISLTLFILPASLYFYTKFSLIPVYKFKWTHFLHFIPLLIVNVGIIPSVYLENLKETPTESELHQYINIVYYFAFYLLLFGYQVASFSFLKKNKRLYYENFSNNEIQRFEYLKKLNIIFTIIFLLSAIKNILVYTNQGPELDIAVSLVKISLLFFFCWIILKRLDAPELFQDTNYEIKTVKELVKSNIKLSFVEETKAEIDEHTKTILKRLNTFMKEKEPYLNASLSINDLSEMLGIPPKELSLLVNKTLNKHFFDFVNEYRIKKAMELLRNPVDRKTTILEILYEVGFNSKSSFNTAFKKHTGLTPTEYKNKEELLVA